MPSPTTNISDWKRRGQVDYFSLFISLWLSFNAWFKDWWLAKWVAVSWTWKDRDFIVKLKDICDWSNKMYSKFSQYMDDDSLRWVNFKTHLAWFCDSLESLSLVNSWINVSYSWAWIEWEWASKVFEDVLTVKKRWIIKLTDNIRFVDDKNLIFRATIENIYQVRCMLIHWDLDAWDGSHRVIQYAYLVLNDLTEDF